MCIICLLIHSKCSSKSAHSLLYITDHKILLIFFCIIVSILNQGCDGWMQTITCGFSLLTFQKQKIFPGLKMALNPTLL